MAVQLKLDRCGVVLLNRGQGRAALGPEPRRGPSQATDCSSSIPTVTRGGQSTATGQITNPSVSYTGTQRVCSTKS